MDDATFEALKRSLTRLIGLDLDGYKQMQMRRRVETFVAKHCGTPAAFIERLARDPALLQATRDMLTINVTEFFRDSAQWDLLQTSILPSLLRRRRSLAVWSAGCSHGQEPLSLAMLLDEAGALPRTRLLATDFDQAALRRVSIGGPYAEEELRGVSEARLARYFTRHDELYRADARLLRRSTFRELNLLDDCAGVDRDVEDFDQAFDLIACRNVMIYFETDAKAALIRRLRAALRPGGVLFIGATEALLGADASGWERLGGNFYARSAEARTRRPAA